MTLVLLVIGGCARPPVTETPPAVLPTLVVQPSGTTALLQAVSPVSDQVVWVSGHAGTYARTTDGGATWRAGRVPGADTLQFRDVHAVDARTAYLLSAGSGELSRIYKTTDAGQTWSLQFINREPRAFFDCMDFWGPERGAAFSDAVDGRTIIVVTADGGRRWDELQRDRVPAALPGEGGFAASGTCLIAMAGGRGWIGTGNAPASRVFVTTDSSRSWIAYSTPIPGGEAAGIISVAFRDSLNGVAMGGNIARPGDHSDNVALSRDGGRSWTLAGRPPFTGAIYGGSYVPNTHPPILVAVGPRGAAYSRDDGASWIGLDTLAYWSVGFASAHAGWAVGPGGRITRLSFR